MAAHSSTYTSESHRQNLKIHSRKKKKILKKSLKTIIFKRKSGIKTPMTVRRWKKKIEKAAFKTFLGRGGASDMTELSCACIYWRVHVLSQSRLISSERNSFTSRSISVSRTEAGITLRTSDGETGERKTHTERERERQRERDWSCCVYLPVGGNWLLVSELCSYYRQLGLCFLHTPDTQTHTHCIHIVHVCCTAYTQAKTELCA